jgi:hypothetical protein
MRSWFWLGRAVDWGVVQQVMLISWVLTRWRLRTPDVVDDPVDKFGRQVAELGHWDKLSWVVLKMWLCLYRLEHKTPFQRRRYKLMHKNSALCLVKHCSEYTHAMPALGWGVNPAKGVEHCQMVLKWGRMINRQHENHPASHQKNTQSCFHLSSLTRKSTNHEDGIGSTNLQLGIQKWHDI